MKKAISLLSFLLILFLLPIPAMAAEESISDAISTVSGLSPLEDTLYRGMMATEERIDISSHNATAAEVVAAMQHLSDGVPELFHVGRTYSYSTKSVTPTYLMSGATLDAARAEYLFALDMIAEGVDPQWSDAEICLYLHDYLCKRFAYDTTYTVYDAYTFLTEGRGVCQSYTLAYTALLSRFGIPVTYATGQDGDLPHIWNIVQLDGEYYHVDVTWGDALTGGEDCFGRATHDNFLKSDAAIEATGHTGRQNRGGIVCDSTRYDAGALTGVDSPAVLLEGEVYAIKNGRVLAFRNGLDGTPAVIYTVTDAWQSGMQTLVDKPAGIAAYGKDLYINTPKSILALDPASGHTEAFLTVSDGMIMTIYNDGETLYYNTADNIFFANERILTATLPSSLPPCTGAHHYTVYATVAASCSSAGTAYKKCTECGHKTAEALPALPHSMETTVVPPTYGVMGYTEGVCTVCGATERTDPTDALPLPTLADYRARVIAATNADTADARLAAIGQALAMEPYIGDVDSSDAYATLRTVMAAYDTAVNEANAAHADMAGRLIFTDFSFFTGAGTAMLLLYLAIRRIFGL